MITVEVVSGSVTEAAPGSAGYKTQLYGKAATVSNLASVSQSIMIPSKK